MKIAIDAKWYFNGPVSGITVVKNLVNKIISLPNVDIVLLCDKKDKNRIGELLKYKHEKNKLKIIYLFNPYNFLTNLFFKPSLLRREGVDVAMFQNFMPFFKAASCKYIAYIHDFLYIDYPEYFTFIERNIYKLITYSASHADYVITITNSEKERIKKYAKISDDKISFVYHGVSDKFYKRDENEKSRIKKKFNLPNKYLLYVGRLNVRKNIETLLKAYKIVDDTDYKIVIVGSEDAKIFNLYKEVRKLGIEERVQKLGYISDDELYEVISAAEIFVFPSFAEGFGLPPLEAMKSGVPTIVSNTTSMPEVCGNASLYFNPNSIEELANKIQKLINNEALKNELIKKGLERSSGFTWSNSVNKIIDIIKNL